MTALQDRAEEILAEMIELQGGSRREPQVNLARGMAQVLGAGEVLLVQAPTGIGKSLAAIAAARAVGDRTLLAPHTNYLQEQLARDARNYSDAIGGVYQTTVLKGRSHYLCKSKADSAYLEAPENDKREVEKILEWADTTETGDRSEIETTTSAWNAVSVSATECTGKHCPFYKECFAEKAREKARTSDLTIVSHSILAQSMQNENLLGPEFRQLIVDEAHHFPSVVGDAFGANISTGQIARVIRNARTIGKVEDLRSAASAALKELELALPPEKDPNRAAAKREKVLESLGFISTTFAAMAKAAKGGGSGGHGELQAKSMEHLSGQMERLLRGFTSTQETWVEWFEGMPILRSSVFDVAPINRENLFRAYDGVAFMSATLRIGKTFDHIARRLGLNASIPWTGANVSSVFDYKNNGLYYLPNGIKAPTDPDQPRQVAAVAASLAKAAEGRTLVLCTSWDAVDKITAHLQKEIGNLYPVLRQERGTDVVSVVREFTENPHTILVATTSLWAGVSIEGDTCICVVIDKLPFPHPNNPVIQAQSEIADKKQPFAGFNQVMLVKAAESFAQGSGRGHRTVKDRALIVCCDSRINPSSTHYRKYAKKLTDTLTLDGIPFTSDHDRAIRFLTDIAATASESGGTVVLEETSAEETTA